MCIYIYTHVSVCMHMCSYVCRYMHVCIYICICVLYLMAPIHPNIPQIKQRIKWAIHDPADPQQAFGEKSVWFWPPWHFESIIKQSCFAAGHFWTLRFSAGDSSAILPTLIIWHNFCSKPDLLRWTCCDEPGKTHTHWHTAMRVCATLPQDQMLGSATSYVGSQTIKGSSVLARLTNLTSEGHTMLIRRVWKTHWLAILGFPEHFC